MIRLTQLLHIDIVDEDGERIGSLMDFRGRAVARGRARNGAPLDRLVFGAPGLLEHIGLRRADSCEVAWKDVVRVEQDRIVIRRNRRKRAR